MSYLAQSLQRSKSLVNIHSSNLYGDSQPVILYRHEGVFADLFVLDLSEFFSKA